MGWKLLSAPKTKKVTKALAKEFMEMDPAPHDRPLSERRLQVYQKLLATGQFRPITWATAICGETNGIYRVNGKHTSTLFAGLLDTPDFYVTIEEYECDTLEDVAKLYATFDSKMMSRTTSDINMSFAATCPELSTLNRNSINLVVTGVSYNIWGQDTYNHQPAERAELLLEHADFALWMNEVFGQTDNKKPLRRMAVVAAMFATYQKSKSAATIFWTAVRDETGIKPELPDRKLAKYLGSTSMIGGLRSKKVTQSNPREMYVKCLHAWNAWRKGETTNLNYHPEKPIPAAK